MAEAKKKGRGIWIFLGLLLVCPIAILFAGVVAAGGIPAMLRYLGRSKTEDAERNLDAIYAGMEAYAFEHGAAQVPIAPRTPAEVPCGARASWPYEADPAWAQLRFSPSPSYYSYEIVREADGAIAVRATGDLDCDGEQSTMTLRARADSPGSLARDPDLVVFEELE